MREENRKAMEQLTALCDDMRARIQAIEVRIADLDRKNEIVNAGQRAWRPVMVTRSDLLLMSDAGERGTLSLSAARILAAGGQLDVERREKANDRVELVDVRGRVVGDLPHSALLNLPRVLASAEASRLLRQAVRVQSVQTVQNPVSGAPGPAANPGHASFGGGPTPPDSGPDRTGALGTESGASPDSSGRAS